ncbi:BrnT family toxin [Methylophilus sp. OH31]|uniref:BrnT family toxin n=1 Tax=Methylophilus sp. OH31 TaxID=1387312 RepID=UPI0009DD4C1E|nr:BrnT family toxin [Methylophilus sp. OH31]
MKFSFTQLKNLSNIQKHGISLEDARLLNWNLLLFLEDERQDYGEVRLIGYAPLGNRLYCIVYTERNEVIHVISLRKANTREVTRYVQARPNIED